MVAKTRGWPSWKFYDYMHSRLGQRGLFHQDTVQLMRQIKAPLDLDAYDAGTYVPLVISHWNNAQQQQQHRFALFIFGSTGHYKPIYKYIDSTYDTPLALYFNNNHFDGVHFLSGLFGGKKYCLECEKPYKKPKEHMQSCKAHCLMCSRVGPEFPCSSEDDGFFKQCSGCNKNFRNSSCYDHHLRSNFCKHSKKCKECGVIWDSRVNSKKGRDGHVCGEKFCQLCKWVKIEGKIAKKLGTNRPYIYEWIKELGLNQKLQKSYKSKSDEQKILIVQKFIEMTEEYKQKRKYSKKEWNQNYTEICNKIGVSKTTIIKWKKQFGISKKRITEKEKKEKMKIYSQIKRENPKKSDNQIAKIVNTSNANICNWKKKFGEEMFEN